MIPSTKSKGSQFKSQAASSKLAKEFVSSTTVNAFQEFKDEVYDCYDAVVNARDNKERLGNVKDILLRHKVRIAAGTGAILVVRALTRKR